jgi:hypothetical protein
MLIIPTIIFAQFYKDKYKTGNNIDMEKINTLLEKPFNNSVISFNTMSDALFFFEIMSKNDMELQSSVYVRGPVASSEWKIRGDGISMDVFTERIWDDATEISNDYRLNSLSYSRNLNLDPVIKIGMPVSDLDKVLGKYNYKIENSYIYYTGSYSISCRTENGKIVSVLIIHIIDV